MPWDANLILANDDADWTYANLVTSNYGTPTSTTRNAGGFAVIDLLALSGLGVNGFAIYLIFLDSAAASDDALTVVAQASDNSDFSAAVNNLADFDLAAATSGIILGSELPCTVMRRVTTKKRYLRIDASCVADDNFGTVWCVMSPWGVEQGI